MKSVKKLMVSIVCHIAEVSNSRSHDSCKKILIQIISRLTKSCTKIFLFSLLDTRQQIL